MGYAHDTAAAAWEDLSHGVRQKRFREGKHTVRIVEFPAGFAGETPCMRGHAGYVLDGACSWDVGGKTVRMTKGDALTIPDDVPHRVFCGADPVTLLFMEYQGKS